MSGARFNRQQHPHVLIAGGGVAGLETLLALRALAGERVDITVVAPELQFFNRSMSVEQPFKPKRGRGIRLEEVCAEFGARWVRADIDHVDHEDRVAITKDAGPISYDMLVLAVGAHPEQWLSRSLTYRGGSHTLSYYGGRDSSDYRLLLDRVISGEVKKLAFVKPAGPSWPLLLYDLALLTAATCAVEGCTGVELSLVTPEEKPLGIFGDRASAAIGALLEEAGVTLYTASYAEVDDPRWVHISPGSRGIEVDRIVTEPRLAGPRLRGIPCDGTGFIPTDAHGRVPERDGVFAAGDATSFPVKQGGLAAQQADAVAETIAAAVGIETAEQPFRPVLRGVLLTGGPPRYLRADISGKAGDDSEISRPGSVVAPDKARRSLPRPLSEQPDRRGVRRHAPGRPGNPGRQATHVSRPGRPPPAELRLRMDSSARIGGYAPIRSYAAIGDGRTVALVADDGSIDWLPLPELDSPSVFGAVLDAERGGRFALAPEQPYGVERRYLPHTNVLETVFSTAGGSVRVTDALTVPATGLGPLREVSRRVEGIAGTVPMAWRVEPRFGYADSQTRLDWRGGVPVASSGGNALAVRSFSAGTPRLGGGTVSGRFEAREGTKALVAICASHHEPLVIPARDELESRLDATATTWREWSDGLSYEGPWRDAVIRSALALKLLVYAPSGALAAAATTSLPEELGGERNWDYRFCWVRDAAFTLSALLGLSCAPEARAYFWWLMHASQLTHPQLRVLYRLDGGADAPERDLPLEGYRGSRPVRAGNAAASQLQLDTYGELLQTAWLFAETGHRIDRDIARRLAEVADLVCRIWGEPDAGIWEVRSEDRHFTQSKMMCWIALDRAADLAERGLIPDRRVARWRAEAAAIREFVETRCYSEEKRSYVRSAGSDELDASLLLGMLFSYGEATSDRWTGTLQAVRRELGRGPFVRRYTGEDGLPGSEGAFLPCSFWLVEALARTGRVADAVTLMDELIGLANDVGLYPEEIEPDSGAFLGNVPQALSHLALISAALAIASETER